MDITVFCRRIYGDKKRCVHESRSKEGPVQQLPGSGVHLSSIKGFLTWSSLHITNTTQNKAEKEWNKKERQIYKQKVSLDAFDDFCYKNMGYDYKKGHMLIQTSIL